jgi:hypothetical protein
MWWRDDGLLYSIRMYRWHAQRLCLIMYFRLGLTNALFGTTAPWSVSDSASFKEESFTDAITGLAN